MWLCVSEQRLGNLSHKPESRDAWPRTTTSSPCVQAPTSNDPISFFQPEVQRKTGRKDWSPEQWPPTSCHMVSPPGAIWPLPHARPCPDGGIKRAT